LPDLEFPTEIGANYFDGQSILRTAPASNIDLATGQDYFYLLFEHDNETTGHSEIAFKKSVTDLELLYTAGGGPGGMDKYADIEAMPWQRYLVKGDFDAKDMFESLDNGRKLVRTHAFRTTIHVMHIDNLSMIISATGPSLFKAYRTDKYRKVDILTDQEIEALLSGV